MSDHARKHQDYIDAVASAIKRLGTTNGHKVPSVNDPADAQWQEFVIAKAAKDHAEARYNKARAAVLPSISNAVTGQFVVRDSAFVAVTAKVQRAPSRLDEDATINAIVKATSLTVDQVRAIFEANRKRGENVIVISAMLKQ